MVAQFQPIEQSEEKQNESPRRYRTKPRSRIPKKKPVAAKRLTVIMAVWMKWAVACAGLIGTIVGTVAVLRQINPPPPPPADPRVEVDERATLTRSSKNKQLELRVNLTLLNRGGQTALIPRPTVSLGDADIPPNDLHFKFADGTSDVIFPVFLSEGASTFAKQIICSIAEGRNGEWGRAGLLRINLDFRPEGHEPISRCLVFIPPVADGNQPLSQDESKCFTITDNCADFGEGFTKRRS